jgi:hypothetical protein
LIKGGTKRETEEEISWEKEGKGRRKSRKMA